MGVYKSQQEFEAILSKLWDKILGKNPGTVY